MNRTIDHVDEAVGTLHSRAAHLRRQAGAVHPLVGKAYRRRAAELELGAWALAIRSGRAPADCRGAVPAPATSAATAA
jgi:hypothetical protein